MGNEVGLETVAVTGANGFVGRRTVDLWLGKGTAVRALCRTKAGADSLPPQAERYVIGSIDRNTEWSTVLDGVDCVVHLAARVHVMNERATDAMSQYREVNVHGTVRLAREAARLGVRRFIFVSSVKANGEETIGEPFSEARTPQPGDPYGISKLEAEHALREVSEETDLEIVIIRPPLIYGPGVGANFRRLLSAVSRGLPLPFGAIENRRSLLYVGNMADVLVTCAHHPAAGGETFMVSDGPPVSSAELVRELSHALGKPPRLLHVPPPVLTFVGRVTGKHEAVRRLTGSLEVDDARVRTIVGWTPPYSMQEGLAETAAWWRGVRR